MGGIQMVVGLGRAMSVQGWQVRLWLDGVICIRLESVL